MARAHDWTTLMEAQRMGSTSPASIREEWVLPMRLYIGKNTGHALGEVGHQFSSTGERIPQIEAKAFQELKHPSWSRKLRSFLDQ